MPGSLLSLLTVPCACSPQQNVLFSRLTVREHLQLYAAIKAVPGGFSGRQAADAAAEMEEVSCRCCQAACGWNNGVCWLQRK